MRRPFATVLVGPIVLFREGLTHILGAAGFRIVASAPCADEAVLTELARHRSVLLVMDSGDDLSVAVRQVELFKEQHSHARIAVLADHYHPGDVLSAFRAGANAYFIKTTPRDAFIKSLELVMLGETVVPAAMLSMVLDRANDHNDDREHEAAVCDVRKAAGEYLEPKIGDMPCLSARETCILNCLIEGDSNKVIARKIKIAEATVKVHVKAILRKIRVHNRTQAAIWAMRNGSSISAMGDGSAAAAKVLSPPTPHLVRALPAAGGTDRRCKPGCMEDRRKSRHSGH
jgi:two-component system, NarL family, nitrate/nitrite response regulator NarL